MAYFMILYVCLALVCIPLLTMGVLLVIGIFRPDVSRRGLRQLRAGWTMPKGTQSEYALHRQRRSLENDAIRRFGQRDKGTPPRD